MQKSSFYENIVFGESQPVITPLVESGFTKEIRIVFRAGQLMKAHKTSFPITVMVLKGVIDFGIGDERHEFREGAIVALEGGVVHDLAAMEDSIVRLSLHKQDSVARVSGVLKL